MNKKIIYSILFFTLFLLSTASMVQPVQGYERGIPDEAIGVEAQREVDIYDEDEWEKCLGKGTDPSDIYDSDGNGADTVGAREMQIIREIEDDEELDFTEEFLFGPDNEGGQGHLAIQQTIAELAGVLPVDQPDPLNAFLYPALPYFLRLAAVAGGGVTAQFSQSINNTHDQMVVKDVATISAEAGVDEYDGTWLKRDKWFFDKDWETDEKWGKKNADYEWDDDPEGLGPIFYDPRDRYDMYQSIRNVKNIILTEIAKQRDNWWNTWINNVFNGTPALYPAWWEITPGYGGVDQGGYATYLELNTTLATMLKSVFLFDVLAPYMLPTDTLLAGYNWYYGFPNSLVHDVVLYTLGLVESIYAILYYNVLDAMPFDDKFAMFSYWAAQGLMNVAVPSDDYVARMVKEFDFDDDVLYRMPWQQYGKDVPYLGIVEPDGLIMPMQVGRTNRMGLDLGGETIYVYAYADVSVEGQVVTVEIEYQDGQYDPKDIINGDPDPNELKDFEYVLTYSDIGSCECVWKRGDTILYQAGFVEVIPGYELTILLGASAVSILALIYVIMKKRKR